MNEDSESILVVTGLPRSGTSMLMQMLAAGGMPVLVDEARGADEDNPEGYFEFSPVKRLRGCASWVPQARGKAVKVISYLLPFLPLSEHYRVVFLARPIAEVIASQEAMLRNATGAASDGLSEILLKQDVHACAFIAQHAIPCLDISHGEVIGAPWEVAERVAAFSGRALDVARMAAAVRPELHRQRGL